LWIRILNFLGGKLYLSILFFLGWFFYIVSGWIVIYNAVIIVFIAIYISLTILAGLFPSLYFLLNHFVELLLSDNRLFKFITFSSSLAYFFFL
jgi:hypothetical protein